MRRIVCVNEILWKYAHSRSRSLRAARADSISGRSFILANWVISWDTQITRTLISKRLPGRMLTPQVGQNGPKKKTIDRSREFCTRFLLRIQLKTDHPCSRAECRIQGRSLIVLYDCRRWCRLLAIRAIMFLLLLFGVWLRVATSKSQHVIHINVGGSRQMMRLIYVVKRGAIDWSRGANRCVRFESVLLFASAQRTANPNWVFFFVFVLGSCVLSDRLGDH